MNDSQTPHPYWLERSPVMFPPTKFALKEPDGLLAIGGDLTPEWLLNAYSHGIFPWFNPGEPILWWTPNPRSVLFIDDLKIRKSLWKRIKQCHKNAGFKITLDSCFSRVMQTCSQVPREGQDGTWISDDMLLAYSQLHQQGHAHSVEVWQDGDLIGGLYGVAIGRMFYGESMFAKQSDASKIALVALCMQLKSWGFEMLDNQVQTDHLASLGAQNLPRAEFETQIKRLTHLQHPAKRWQFDIGWFNETAAFYQK